MVCVGRLGAMQAWRGMCVGGCEADVGGGWQRLEGGLFAR